MKRVLFLLSALCITSLALAQTSREEVDAHPHVAMSTHSVYAAPYYFKPIAKAPKGYKPFYISHYGRHGSRHESQIQYVDFGVRVTRIADSLNLLTPKGKEVAKYLLWAASLHEGRIGELTPLGVEQHKGIARRMYARFKPVFYHGAIVDSRSSNYTRCILSMAAFNESLKECKPMLEIRMDAAEEHQNVARPIRSAVSNYTHRERNAADHEWHKTFYAWAATKDFDAPLKRIFTDVDAVVKATGESKISLMLQIYKRMAFVQNQGYHDRSLLESVYTPDDVYLVYQSENYRWYCAYFGANLPDSKRYLAPMHYLVDDIVKYADLAIEGKNSAVANLRFGHDYYLLALLSLLNSDQIRSDIDYSSVDNIAEQWRAYRFMTMGSNLQMVFYRSKKSDDVLVRFLENENDITLPLKSVEGPFYKWSDVRKYMTDRANEWKKYQTK